MLVPNFFTLLGLCAGLTSIRMSIEGRYELALAAIVFAAMLDGIAHALQVLPLAVGGDLNEAMKRLHTARE